MVLQLSKSLSLQQTVLQQLILPANMTLLIVSSLVVRTKHLTTFNQVIPCKFQKTISIFVLINSALEILVKDKETLTRAIRLSSMTLTLTAIKLQMLIHNKTKRLHLKFLLKMNFSVKILILLCKLPFIMILWQTPNKDAEDLLPALIIHMLFLTLMLCQENKLLT